jgi:ribonuclease-3
MPLAETVDRAQRIVEYQFQDVGHLITALTHSSSAGSRLKSNERLEFLGDSILGMVVCEDLFRRFDEWLEGDLTKVKSFVVSRKVCADVADAVGLTDLLILGHGIDTRTVLPTSLRAAVFEAVIGAVFMDGGFEPAKRFILRAIAPEIAKCAANQNRDNHKSTLQQYAQRQMATTPYYESLDEQGPDHCKCFEVCVVIGGRRFPSAWGSSKKEAEQEAARRALELLRSDGIVG